MVLQLLEKGFEVTQKDDHSAAIIAQTLARFLMHQKNFEQAKFWAQRAIDLEKKNFSLWDTLAQVYKREFYHVKDGAITDEARKIVIDIARKSAKYFQDAQKLIEKTFEYNRERNYTSSHGHTKDLTNRNTSYFGKNLLRVLIVKPKSRTQSQTGLE